MAGLNTLIDFRYTQHFRAPRGKGGSGSNRTGAGGKDLVIKVPIGTQILADDENRTMLADLTKDGQQIIFLRGGMGGRGNASYKTSTNRAPRQHQTGIAGEEMYVWLRLKLLADVGPRRPPQRRQIDLPQLASPTPRPRSALTRSPPSTRNWASSATRAASSSSPTSPG